MWRVVVADQRSPRDGRIIESIGHYNAQTEPSTIVIDRARLDHWIERGAQPTNTIRKLMRAPNTETRVVEPPDAAEAREQTDAAEATGASAESGAESEGAAAEAPAAEAPAADASAGAPGTPAESAEAEPAVAAGADEPAAAPEPAAGEPGAEPGQPES